MNFCHSSTHYSSTRYSLLEYSLLLTFFMKFQITFLIVFIPFILFAQYPVGTPTAGLKAYYSFDNCDGTDDTGNGSDGEMFGMPDCNCGIVNSALEFDGVDDYLIFSGLNDLVNTYFDDDDFTLSFYVKNYGSSLLSSLFSKRVNCGDNLGLDLRFQTSQNIIQSEFEQEATLRTDMTIPLTDERCWQHVVITRRDRLISGYVDGELAVEEITPTVLNINNSSRLTFSNSPCIGTNGTTRFRGLIDEMAVYDEALTALQVRDMYFPTDLIGTRDTILFKGNSIQSYLRPTCATSFDWSPITGVSDPTIANPILMPEDSITYTLVMTDDEGCSTIDRVTINVIDPEDLDCDNIFLPKAFTPNGDELNDNYGISNPLAIFDFTSFDIYSRWGGRVFSAESQFDQWDGTNNGANLNAGIYVYQLRYKCNGENRRKSGSITLIK